MLIQFHKYLFVMTELYHGKVYNECHKYYCDSEENYAVPYPLSPTDVGLFYFRIFK